MDRTVGRPLPSGRLSDRQVTRFGLLATAAGFALLVVWDDPVLMALAAISWLIYVCAYTPLKSRTAWQTPVGALAGAMPVLLGSTAVGRPGSSLAFALFGVVFLWQFPHAMAIAWLYRRQFALAEVKVASVVDPSGRTAGWLAAAAAAALLPMSLVPLWFSAAARSIPHRSADAGTRFPLLLIRFLSRPANEAAPPAIVSGVAWYFRCCWPPAVWRPRKGRHCQL